MKLRKMFSDILEALEHHRVYHLNLQCLHEAFGLGVIIRISPAAHRTDEPVGMKKLPVEFGGVLAATDALLNVKPRLEPG